MKVSVIVPVYNVEKFLCRCIDSILSQNYQDFELICVNDCSPDNSISILREYEKRYQDKVIVVDNEKNMGLGLARKEGIKICKGEYIAFIDSDDYIAPDYLESYVREMETHDCDVVVAGFTQDIEGKFIKADSSVGVWSVLTYPFAWAKLYRTDFLKKNNIDFSDIRKGEDIYFGLCLFYHGARIHNFKYNGYYYYLNRNSITRSLTYDKEFEKDISLIFNKFFKEHDIVRLTSEKREYVMYTYVSNMINALITYGHGCRPKIMKKKYDFFMQDMKALFPDYKKNSLYGILKPEGQTLKIRLGVGVTMLLHKIGLDKLMFYMISMI